MPLSKNKTKYIKALELKKGRKEEQAFVAEGHKSVGDLLLAGFIPKMIVATNEWESPITLTEEVDFVAVTEEELRKASLLQHPQQVLGVFRMPTEKTLPTASHLHDNLCLCLDGVQDPGNLGTIIRTADWFGIKDIVCSPTTADAYNPKAIQATMGSIARVSIHYTDLPTYLKGIRQAASHDIPIYGTFLDGRNLYSSDIQAGGIIVMGNEGNGISPEVSRLVTHKLLIPPYPANRKTAESLNVSIATAIICAEFRRIQKR